MGVNKISWQQIGHVTRPGRYMFRFGWLTVSPEDIPFGMFALVKTAAAENGEEFHLGAFELRTGPLPNER